MEDKTLPLKRERTNLGKYALTIYEAAEYLILRASFKSSW